MAGDLHGRTVLEIDRAREPSRNTCSAPEPWFMLIEIDAVAVDHLRTTFAEEIEEQKLC